MGEMRKKFIIALTIVFVAGLVASTANADLVSHWKLDGDADDSAGVNHGTIYGNPQWTSGVVDGALSFDGLSDYIDLGDVDEFEFGNTDFSISAWFYTMGTHGPPLQQGEIICKYNWSGYGRQWRLVQSAPGNVVFYTNPTGGGSHEYLTSLTSGYQNQWVHVAAVRSGPTKLLYINGVLDTTGSTAGVVTGKTSGAYIGAVYDPDIGMRNLFNGIIDDVRIYDTALSAEEIQQLYQDGFPDVVGLEIIGPGEVAENFSASYKAIAHYDNDETRNVTNSALWVVEPNTAANIDENGVLTTKDFVKHQSATILASYTEGDVTVDAEKAIGILAICPMGTALQFDGVDDYVNCGNDNSLNITDEITLTAWVKMDRKANDYEKIVMKSTISTWDPWTLYGLDFDRGGDNARKVRMFASDGTIGSYATAISTTNIQNGVWYHVAGTFNGSEVRIYLNGVSEATTPTTFSQLGINDEPVLIGVFHKNLLANDFRGIIDEVAIYNRALSAEEIQANMHQRLAGDEPGLVGYWDFDEGGGQIVYDLSGNGNNGQLGSTPIPDVSDPAWVESDAPIGICSLYQIATMAAERALWRKLALLEELLAGLAEEWAAYDALEELLESGDYGDLSKADIVKARQEIHTAIQHQGKSKKALEKSIENLEDALTALGWQPEPEPEPNPNLIAHWKFDEASGTIAYDSAGSNDGAIYGATWTTGQIDGALSFDGVDDYVEVPDDSSLRPQYITLSAWVKPEEITDRHTIIGKSTYSDASGEQYALGILDGRAGIHIKRNSGCNPWSGWYRVYSQTILGVSQWYLITSTWNGSTLKLYINGTLESSNNNVPSGPIDDCPGGTLRIGLWWANDLQRFHGKIDDIRIYNRALFAEEVQQLYQDGLD